MAKSKEELLSPVNDPGFYPYPRMDTEIMDDVMDAGEPRDPGKYIPAYRKERNGEER